MCTYAARMRHKTSSLAEISDVKRPNLGPSTQFLFIYFFSSKHHAFSVTQQGFPGLKFESLRLPKYRVRKTQV